MTAAMTAAALLLASLPAANEPGDASDWETTTLTGTFYSEGAASADFDRDGHADLLVGPFIYHGPDWTRRHEIREPKAVSPLGYSDEFLAFAADLTGDGYPDAVSVGFPGKETVWFENPGATPDAANPAGRDYRTDGHWKRHLLAPVVDNESPGFADLTGDGRPELIGQLGGSYGYFQFDPGSEAGARGRWAFHAVSEPDEKLGRFTHGLGAGDVDGDGRPDLLTKDGWFRQPEDLSSDGYWEENPHPFAPRAAQLVTLDADGDGDADVVTSRDAHGYGLDWFEQVPGPDGGVAWVKHEIMGDAKSNAAADADGNPVLFTQPHALAAADVNGDGLTDLVTGKRFWAHGPTGDADPGGDPVLYWWELTRDGGEVTFVPHRIDAASGIGTQVHVADVTGDGKPDVVVGNKRGAFVSVQP